MCQAAGRYLAVLEQRLAALDRLAAVLREAQSAVVAMDLGRTLQTTLHQQDLCQEIRCFDRQLAALAPSLASAPGIGVKWSAPEELWGCLDGDSQRKLRSLLNGLEKIQAEIRRLNRIQAVLLCRSRRSVNVLLNVMGHYTGVYGPRRAVGAATAQLPGA